MHKSLHMHILKDITVQNDGFEPGTAVSSAVLNILTAPTRTSTDGTPL